MTDRNVFDSLILAARKIALEEKTEHTALETLLHFLVARYKHHYTPQEILGYIYAVLHAPTYRSRYAKYLRVDFPRIPFLENAIEFENLSRLGWGLMQAHLLRE